MIKSKALKEPRTISIHLPALYNFTDQKFPVVYLLDGIAHFEHASDAVEYHSDRSLIPQLIFAAIHNVDRTRDFHQYMWNDSHYQEEPKSSINL